jgi:hypothetical protein
LHGSDRCLKFASNQLIIRLDVLAGVAWETPGLNLGSPISGPQPMAAEAQSGSNRRQRRAGQRTLDGIIFRFPFFSGRFKREARVRISASQSVRCILMQQQEWVI